VGRKVAGALQFFQEYNVRDRKRKEEKIIEERKEKLTLQHFIPPAQCAGTNGSEMEPGYPTRGIV